MQYKKLTPSQKRIKGWRIRRDRLVCRMLASDPHLRPEDALRRAHQKIGPMPGGR